MQHNSHGLFLLGCLGVPNARRTVPAARPWPARPRSNRTRRPAHRKGTRSGPAVTVATTSPECPNGSPGLPLHLVPIRLRRRIGAGARSRLEQPSHALGVALPWRNGGMSCPASWDGLAGASPVRVVAKQPGSWWPAEGETRPSRCHDQAPSGGEQSTSPCDEEPCSLDMVAIREPSPSSLGEGHGRRGDLGDHNAYVPAGVRRAEWLHSPSWNRRDLSRHRQLTVVVCHTMAPGSGETYKQRSCEAAERRAEVGAGHGSNDRRKKETVVAKGL